jgi:hypothetical protein
VENVPPLTKLWSPGSESGNRFGRIYDLLLDREARSKGISYHSTNDSSGDYRGVDAYSGGGFEIQNKVEGFSFKFFPCPFDDDHKKQIVRSLMKAKEKFAELGIWILCTPDNLLMRDREWFENLRERHDVPFRIKHWGMTRLTNLLLDHPPIGQPIYPQLFVSERAPADQRAHRKHLNRIRVIVVKPILDELQFFEAIANGGGPMTQIGSKAVVVPSASVSTPPAYLREPTVEVFRPLLEIRTNPLYSDLRESHAPEAVRRLEQLASKIEKFGDDCRSLVLRASDEFLKLTGFAHLADWSQSAPPRLYHLSVGQFIYKQLMKVYEGADSIRAEGNELRCEGATKTLFTGSDEERQKVLNAIDTTMANRDVLEKVLALQTQAEQLRGDFQMVKGAFEKLALLERLPGSCSYT